MKLFVFFLARDSKDKGIYPLGACVFENSGAFVQGRSGGFDVVDKAYPFTGEIVVFSQGKSTLDIFLSLGGC